MKVLLTIIFKLHPSCLPFCPLSLPPSIITLVRDRVYAKSCFGAAWSILQERCCTLKCTAVARIMRLTVSRWLPINKSKQQYSAPRASVWASLPSLSCSLSPMGRYYQLLNPPSHGSANLLYPFLAFASARSSGFSGVCRNSGLRRKWEYDGTFTAENTEGLEKNARSRSGTLACNQPIAHNIQSFTLPVSPLLRKRKSPL